MHLPYLLSSKPTVHARQMFPYELQSLQLLGQETTKAMRRKVTTILIFIIIDFFFIIEFADDRNKVNNHKPVLKR